ncbi:MAG: abortive phage infection protein [Methylococcaceae bacterium]|nr:abortive phage infection protein [Methylococcaceae bacterium]
MFTQHFYNIIDGELDALLQKYQNDELIKKYKNPNQKKSYALLIWFLEFYGRRANYKDFITDGDNDSSCDIIFDNTNNQGEKIFYVVQSKWNTVNNSEKETSRDEILKALNDFETLLHGEKQNVNDRLKVKIKELDKHLKSNGEVKFIFLSLSQYKGNADENINAFIKSDEKIKCDVIDINRIKHDYIDRIYKEIKPLNPLESYQNPEESPITLEIIQENGTVKIEKPFEAYMFLLRPKSIYELFDKYGFALFYKNIRNPLLQSQFNEDIENTVSENPDYFWYYNNGITAIASLLPAIGKQAEKIELTGLQIINGTQTVYSIYRAYKNASNTKRQQMDSRALVTVRLLRSGGKDFDLDVTRYTNSQNPVDDRDFCANDDIQIKLQNASYQTNVWYGKRRDEFRETPDGITEIPNFIFANAYLAYHLQDPVTVLKNHAEELKTGKNLNFISYRDHKDGFYENIFNEKTSFEDMLCAFYILDSISNHTSLENDNFICYEDSFETITYHLLALFSGVFTKYLKSKFDEKINVTKYIIKIYEKHEIEIILKTFIFINSFVEKKIKVTNNKEKTQEKGIKFLYELSHYEKINDDLEGLAISIEDIEGIALEKYNIK